MRWPNRGQSQRKAKRPIALINIISKIPEAVVCDIGVGVTRTRRRENYATAKVGQIGDPIFADGPGRGRGRGRSPSLQGWGPGKGHLEALSWVG